MSAYVGRLAPSPTGLLHLGVARTSLAAWLDARAHGGRLILRVEDVDRPREVPGAAAALERDLAWLGIDWDEGPLRQSERCDLYGEAIRRLEAAGRVFPCTCSRKEVARAASAPHGPSDEGPRYPGTCRSGAAPRPGRAASLRFRTEAGDVVHHVDRAYGPVDQDVAEAVGDFVLRRADGLWAYQLAVTVDDLAMGVTTVVRGADLLASTPRQLLLRKILDPSAPPLATLHVPLVLGPSGQRLAKRDGATTIAELREGGARAESLVGRLAASLGLVEEGATVTAEELIPRWLGAKLPTEDGPLRWD